MGGLKDIPAAIDVGARVHSEQAANSSQSHSEIIKTKPYTLTPTFRVNLESSVNLTCKVWPVGGC